MGGYEIDVDDKNKNLNDKILDIINKDQISKTGGGENNSEKKPNLTANYHSEDYPLKNSDDTPMTKATKTLSDSSSSGKKGGGTEVDNKIKKILEKDLGETDLETSLSYRPETNDKDLLEVIIL